MEFPSVSTDSIHTQVTAALRQAIVSGQLKPGQKLSEEALAQQFGVSRTPVREAFKQLEREGLVQIIPRVGTCVTKHTEEEIIELFAVKEVLEGLAAGLMAQRGNIPELAELENALRQQEQAGEQGDVDRFVQINLVFHDIVVRGSGNSKLQFLFSILINQLPYQRFVYLSLKQPNRTENSLEEHRSIVEAIKSGDFDRAEQAMRRHVRSSAVQLHKGLVSQLI
ncbi:MAG: GntR family transcriptional regulator [Alicyclobacillus sp.]|nr:GntR family transcriptional regulator [Alicyclobacillus sp.]